MATNVDDFELERWVKHRERALEHKWYSVERMDLLLVSVSAGGIYTCLEVIKFIRDKPIAVDYTFLKAAGILFTVAIVANFLSQWFAKKAHVYESKWANQMIAKTKGVTFSQTQMDLFDKKGGQYDKGVGICNVIALWTMLGGVVLVSAFLLLEF